MAPVCAACGRDAPIVYRGVVPYCTACGALRAPLSNRSVNLAGRPSLVGGAVASVLGWLVLLFGGSIALGIGLLLYALGATGIALAVALPIGIVALVLGTVLVRSGQSLHRSGADAARATREDALVALAAQHGAVRAEDAARMLGTSVEQADALLTDLAKSQPDRVALDVDDQGVVWYRVASGAGIRIGEARVRVGAPEAEAEADAEAAPGAITEKR